MINFGGLQKNSLIDYPDKISCVLFLTHCNFECPYCHNPDLVKGRFTNLTENDIYEFLKKRKGLLDGVVISGGEPTLEKKELEVLCRKIKEIGYPIKIDTNGSRPNVIKELTEKGLVDYIAMDVKTDPLQYSHFFKTDCTPDDIISSIRIIMESGLSYEFRTTCVKPLVTVDIIKKICRFIQGAKLYVLQQFHNATVLDPKFSERYTFYNTDELLFLKSVAEPLVQKCIVR